MGQHYTRNTVSVMKHCKKCGRTTPHRVDDRRLGNACLDCIAGTTGAVAAAKPDSVLVDRPCICARFPFAHYHPTVAEKLSAMAMHGLHAIVYDKATHSWKQVQGRARQQ